MASVMVPALAQAQVIRSFSSRYTTNEAGDVRLFGNTVVSCSDLDPDCADARNGLGAGDLNNNNAYFMVDVDVDQDANTFNATSALSSVPAGATVLFAGLYWGGETGGFSFLDTDGITFVHVPAEDEALKNMVKIQTPGSFGYTDVVADQCDETAIGSEFGVYYNCFADVTALVPQDGQGTFTVANVQTSQGPNSSGGWGMVVAYQDPAEPIRNIVVYDGFAAVTTSPTGIDQVDISVTDFRTPFIGQVSTRVGVIGHEGDRQATNARASLGSISLGDALNPANNIFNSTAADMGSASAGRSPSYDNLLGFDVDLIDASGVLGNGAQSTTIRVETQGDFYYPAVVTFATEVYAPEMSFIKSVQDINGGDVEPGDTLRYTFEVENAGGDFADDVVVTDVLANALDYVPNSLTIDGQPAGSRGDWNSITRTVTARIGSGAGSSSGGTLGAGDSILVSFDTTVSPLARAGDKINNQGRISYEGRTLNESIEMMSDDTSEPGAADLTSVTIDQTLPTVEITSPGDGATVAERRPSISGTSEPGTTVTVSIDGSVFVNVVADANGDWTFMPGSDLSDGSHVVVVVAEDAAGNEFSDNSSFTVDLTAPPISITGPTNGSVLGDGDVVVSGTTEPGATVTVTRPDGSTQDVVADGNGDWQLSLGDLAESASYTITATVEDNLGNSASASTTFSVDETAPAVSIDSPTDGTSSTDSRPTFSGTAEPGSSVTVTVDGGDSEEITVDANGDWSWTPSADLGDGDHDVVVTARDEAGNEASDTVTIGVDTMAPVVTIDAPANGAEVDTATPTISGTAEPGLELSVTIDGVVVGTVTADANGAWSYTPDELGSGAHTVVVTTADDAGNEGEATSSFTVALAPTEVEIKRPADGDKVNTRRPLIEGVTEPNTEIQISIDGGEPVTVTSDDEGRFEYPPGVDLTDGEHTVSATTNDGGQDSVTFTVDPEVPTLTIDSPSGGEQVANDKPTFAGTADPGQTVEIFVDGEKVGETTADADGNWSWTFDEAIDDGEHTVRVEATGDNGESASSSVTFEVIDSIGAGSTYEVSGGCNCSSSQASPVSGLAHAALVLFGIFMVRVRRRRR